MKSNLNHPQATTAEVHAWLVAVARFCVRKVQDSPNPDLLVSEDGFRILLHNKLTGDFDHWWAPAFKARWN